MENRKCAMQINETNIDVPSSQNVTLLCCDTSTECLEISSTPSSISPVVSPRKNPKNTFNTQKPSDNVTDLNILRSRKTYSRNSSKVPTTSNEISSFLTETSSDYFRSKNISDNLQDSGELTGSRSIESSNTFETKCITNGISQVDLDSIHIESGSRNYVHPEHALFCDDDMEYCFPDYRESSIKCESSVSLPETPKGYQRTRKNLKNEVGRRKIDPEVDETFESKSSEEGFITFCSNDKNKSSNIHNGAASKTEENYSSRQSSDLFNLVFRKGKNISTYSSTKSTSTINQSSTKLYEHHPPSLHCTKPKTDKGSKTKDLSLKTNTTEYDPNFSSKLLSGLSLMDLVQKYSEENKKPCANKPPARKRKETVYVENESSVSKRKSSAANITGNKLKNYSPKNVGNSSFGCVKSINKTRKTYQTASTDRSEDTQGEFKRLTEKKSNVFSKTTVQTQDPAYAPGFVKSGLNIFEKLADTTDIKTYSPVKKHVYKLASNTSKVSNRRDPELPTKEKGKTNASKDKAVPKYEENVKKLPATSKRLTTYSKLDKNSNIEKQKSNHRSPKEGLESTAVHSEESAIQNSSHRNSHFKQGSKSICGIKGNNDINSVRELVLPAQLSLNHQLSLSLPTISSSFPLIRSSQNLSSVDKESNLQNICLCGKSLSVSMHSLPQLNRSVKLNSNEDSEHLSAPGPSTSHSSINRFAERKLLNYNIESTFTNPVHESSEHLPEIDSSDQDLNDSGEWYEIFQTERSKAVVFRNRIDDTFKTIRQNCVLESMAKMNKCITVQSTVSDFFKCEDVASVLKDYVNLSDLPSCSSSVEYDFPENFQNDLLSSIMKDYVHTIIPQILPPNTVPKSKVDSRDILSLAYSKLPLRECSILEVLFLRPESLRLKDVIVRLNFMALVVIYDEFFKRERGKKLLLC